MILFFYEKICTINIDAEANFFIISFFQEKRNP